MRTHVRSTRQVSCKRPENCDDAPCTRHWGCSHRHLCTDGRCARLPHGQVRHELQCLNDNDCSNERTCIREWCQNVDKPRKTLQNPNISFRSPSQSSWPTSSPSSAPTNQAGNGGNGVLVINISGPTGGKGGGISFGATPK